jgi:uncharacterized protein with FMN-binding domain
VRRAIPVLVATAGSLALLAGFHTTPGSSGVTIASGPTPTGPPSTTAGTTTSAPGGTPATAATRTVDGPDVNTDYGDVQVRVTLQGTKITDVEALRLPSDRSRSRQISQAAGPLLRSEALKAQSANIDLVSGASYTSDAYARSLQGALDQAGR